MNEMNLNLQNQAYQQIIGRILRSEYKPGQKISQKNIEEDLQLGRTPVREALLRLKRDGLIYSIPQSGTYVTKIDLDAAINARFIRENLEGKIVAEAATLKDNLLLTQARDAIKLQEKYAANGQYHEFFNADEEFHKTFYLMTDHIQVWDWLQTINIQFNRFRWLRLAISDLPWGTLIEQHKEILNAVENHDPIWAVNAATKHLHLMFEEEMAVLKMYPEYFDNIPK